MHRHRRPGHWPAGPGLAQALAERGELLVVLVLLVADVRISMRWLPYRDSAGIKGGKPYSERESDRHCE
eukprot:428903-Hanusia_phi.AAC.3